MKNLSIFFLIAVVSLSAFGSNIVYQQDFSSDPNFITDYPQHLYWDETNQWFNATIVDVSSGEGHYYAFSPTFDTVSHQNDFHIVFDINVSKQNWGNYPAIIFQDASQPWALERALLFRFFWADSTYRKFHITNRGGDNPDYVQHWSPTVPQNVWFTVEITYRAATQKMDLTVTNKANGSVFWQLVDTHFPVDRTFNSCTLGMLTKPPRYGRTSTILVDNIEIQTASVENLPPVIAGSANLSGVEGEQFFSEYSIEDIDGEVVRVDAIDLPDGATFTLNTVTNLYEFDWTPDYTKGGASYVFLVEAEDDQGEVVTLGVTVEVFGNPSGQVIDIADYIEGLPNTEFGSKPQHQRNNRRFFNNQLVEINRHMENANWIGVLETCYDLFGKTDNGVFDGTASNDKIEAGLAQETLFETLLNLFEDIENLQSIRFEFISDNENAIVFSTSQPLRGDNGLLRDGIQFGTGLAAGFALELIATGAISWNPITAGASLFEAILRFFSGPDPLYILPILPELSNDYARGQLAGTVPEGMEEVSAHVYLDYVHRLNETGYPWPVEQYESPLTMAFENDYGTVVYDSFVLLNASELRNLDPTRSYIVVPKKTIDVSGNHWTGMLNVWTRRQTSQIPTFAIDSIQATLLFD